MASNSLVDSPRRHSERTAGGLHAWVGITSRIVRSRCSDVWISPTAWLTRPPRQRTSGEPMGRESRATWARRVRRWTRSGLTAERFARREGVNAGTLSFWRWKLRHGTPGGREQAPA